MDDFFFGLPKQSDYKFDKADFVSVSDVSEKYIDGKDDKFIYIDARWPVFEIGGILHPDKNSGEYFRLDAAKKDIYTDAHKWLGQSTAGGTLRFFTNAGEVALKVTYRGVILGMHHFCDRGVYGFDMYTGTGTDRRYAGKQMQTFAENPKENCQVLELGGNETELTINFPLYGGIEKLSIGLPADCFVSKPSPRKFKPVAFYGSSITQGGCVSRPGNMYSHILCRALDCDNINLGFSGSAFGETYAADFLGTRELSAFVMDYDYNSPNPESLKATHLPFYEAFRKHHPDTPVVMVSHPCYKEPNENDKLRRDIVKASYELALSRGDNVYFVDGCEFFPKPYGDLFSVDNLHPNDLGNYYMAKVIWPELKKALGVD
jgi:hypothetical protein